MARVKNSVATRARRKRVLKLAKGYYGAKHILYRTANEQVMRSLRYAYRDRKQTKREMRKLWIARVNAGARLNGLSYSKLMNGLKIANITVNRKMLSEMAIHDEKGFAMICEAAKKALVDGPTAVVENTTVVEKPAAKKPAAKKAVKVETETEEKPAKKVAAKKPAVKKEAAEKKPAAKKATAEKAEKTTTKKTTTKKATTKKDAE